jgi:Mn-dependent DtxR family transcriptional regulator
MITVSKEDYLKSILEAESEGEEVISARLADL